MEILKENWEGIIAIVTLIFSSGLIIAIKKFIKEVKDVVDAVKNSQDPKSEDGSKISDKEKDVILKDLIEALEQANNVWKLLSKIFKKK